MLESVLGLGFLVASGIIALYSGSFFVLIALYLRTRHQPPTAPDVPDDELLSVTLQLPIFNERHVVERLIDAVGAIDYPRHKLVVQVLDDSTDETTACSAESERMAAQGLSIELIHRPDRSGYKAGRWPWAGASRRTASAFRRRFHPRPISAARAHFNADPGVALVQSRLAHLNNSYNLLTRAQVLAIDQHFAVEQVARSRAGLPMAMNGTAASGGGGHPGRGWLVGGHLTEDLDLSYRAFLKGWRFRYVVDVAVPGEVPPQAHRLQDQQARWAKVSRSACASTPGRAARGPHAAAEMDGPAHQVSTRSSLWCCSCSAHPARLIDRRAGAAAARSPGDRRAGPTADHRARPDRAVPGLARRLTFPR